MQVQGRRQLQAWLPLAGTWTGGPPAGAGVSPPTHLFAAAAAAAVGVSVARCCWLTFSTRGGARARTAACTARKWPAPALATTAAAAAAAYGGCRRWCRHSAGAVRGRGRSGSGRGSRGA
eukprot:scaffold24909_cov14-Tisochrysis_lutea.AAC.1